MTLYQLLKKADFEAAFAQIMQYAPEIAGMRENFTRMWDYLISIHPEMSGSIVVDAFEESYLGEGVISVNLFATEEAFHNLSDIGFMKELICPLYFSCPKIAQIPISRIVAYLLWKLVAMEKMENVAIRNEIRDGEKVEKMIYGVTGFNSPPDKAAYKISCLLDDHMWRNEERTIVCLYSSPGYEDEVKEIIKFIMDMMRNPTIIYGANNLRGIAMKAFFLKRS